MNSKKSLITRVFALVMALVLAGGLVPSSAFASTFKSATLQIAYDSDGDNDNELVVNRTFYYSGEKTVADLFEAAKQGGFIKEYVFATDYGYLQSVDGVAGTYNEATKSGVYWASYKDCGYDDTGASTKNESLLVDGATYSFDTEGYCTAAGADQPAPFKYDWESTDKAYVAENVVGQLTSGATLQLAYDADGDGKDEIVFNKVYGFTDGATLGDLFEAAKQAGDIKDYRFDGSVKQGYYLGSVTFSNGIVCEKSFDTESNIYTYWANYKNGNYASGATDCSKDDLLTDGVSFSFGIECYKEGASNVGPVAADWSSAGDPLVSTAVAEGNGDPTPEPDDDSDDKATVNKYDAEKAALLLENLAARFKKDCADASVSNTTFNAAVALNQLGMGANLDVDAILENFEHDEAKSTGAYAKYILALTAAGVDCTNVTLSDGVSHNIVSDMEKTLNVDNLDIWSAVCILPVYQNYADNSGLEAKLIEKILSCAGESGLFGAGKYYDTQTTAQAIVALLPYRNSNSEVKDAIEKAVDAIYKMQNKDGGFAYSNKGDASNLDATSAVIVALTSLGYDCAEGKDLTTSNGSTPLGWLVAQADQDSLDAFDGAVAKKLTSVEVLTASDALLGLTADAQFNANGSFAAYKLKAVARNSEDQSKKADGTTNTTTKTTTKKNVPSTGDESVGAGVVLAVAATGAVVVLEAKRRRNAA